MRKYIRILGYGCLLLGIQGLWYRDVLVSLKIGYGAPGNEVLMISYVLKSIGNIIAGYAIIRLTDTK